MAQEDKAKTRPVKGATMQLFTVYVVSHVNRDKSVTFGMRWVRKLGPDGSTKHLYRRVLRTEPKPTKGSLQKWRREVAEIRLETERKLNGEARQFVDARRIGDAIADYLVFVGQNRARSTSERLERGLAFFLEYIRDDETGGPKNISGLYTTHIARYRDYLAERGLAASTVNCYLADLSGLLTWAVSEGFAADNPVRRVRKMENRGRRSEVPLRTPAELREVLDNMTTDIRRSTVGLLATTGCRIGEASALTWDCWDRGEDLLILKPQVREWSKNRTKKHDRSIPLIDESRHFLMALSLMNDGGPYIVGPLRGTITLKTQPNAWLKPLSLTPHDLRRFFRTALETCSIETYAIDDLMGHRTGKVRAAYTPAENLTTARNAMAAFAHWLGQ